MTLQEFRTTILSNTEYELLATNWNNCFKKYPNFMNWFNLTFSNFTLKYDDIDLIMSLFNARILNNIIEIAKIESVCTIVNNAINEGNPLLVESDLGDKTITTNSSTATQSATTNSTNSGKSTESYSGYNVDNAEFETNSNDNTATSTNKIDGSNSATSTVDKSNKMDNLFKLQNYELKTLFNNIYFNFVDLFITIY